MTSPFPPSSNPFSSGLAQPAHSARALANLLDSLTRRGLYYHRKTIDLDGLTFEECSFQNCTFVTQTGNFMLKNCRIEGPETVFMYQGSALNVVRLHELMNSALAGKVVFPSLFPQMDKDNRVTIA